MYTSIRDVGMVQNEHRERLTSGSEMSASKKLTKYGHCKQKTMTYNHRMRTTRKNFAYSSRRASVIWQFLKTSTKHFSRYHGNKK